MSDYIHTPQSLEKIARNKIWAQISKKGTPSCRTGLTPHQGTKKGIEKISLSTHAFMLPHACIALRM
jgi:hypothetical protein